MNNLLLADGWHPGCFNRKPYADGRWLSTGRFTRGKPVLRWSPRWFVDRCTLHDDTPVGENYARDHHYNCEGCRWLP